MIDLRCILFDLDGTLLDTAPDMAYTLNQLRHRYGFEELPYQTIRPHVAHGVRALIRIGFDTNDFSQDQSKLIDEYLSLYHQHKTNTTRLFPGMDNVLNYLDTERIPFGIVTNKPTRFTTEILNKLDLANRARCVVCGDTLTKRKPDPDPLLYACRKINQPPENSLFVGDALIDVQASQAAGIRSLVALYGYIKHDEDPFSWKADGYIQEPTDIIRWLQEHQKRG